MAGSTIVRCPSCGTRNRLGASATGVPRCAVCHTALPWIVTADAASFDGELAAAVPVLVDFWAPWCAPCRAVTPVLEACARDHAAELKLIELNVDEAPDIAARYGVQGIPLLVVHRDGRELDRLLGAPAPAHIRRWVEQHLAPASP